MSTYSKVISRQYLKAQMDSVRKVLQEHCRVVDRSVKKFTRTVEEHLPKSKESYIREVIVPQLKVDAVSARETSLYTSLAELRASFDSIRDNVTEWACQPVPSAFTSVIESAPRYGLTFGPAELKGLAKMAQGNYLAEKIIAGMASNAGIEVGHFIDADTLIKTIDHVQRDCEIVLDNYAGQFSTEAKRFVGELAHEKKPVWHLMYFASEYLGRDDSSLSELEKTLTDIMEPVDRLGLLPETRAKIESYFDGADDESKKIEVCINLLETHKNLDTALSVYDPILYSKALKTREETAIQRVTEAVQKQLLAQTEVQEAQSNLARTQVRNKMSQIRTSAETQ